MKHLLTILFFFLALNFAFSQNIGIGTTTPGFPLNFSNTLGDKISLYGNTGNHYGFGIQNSLLQIHTDAPGSNIALGYGTSSSFTERMTILNNTGYDGMSLNGRLILKNGSTDLVGGGGGVWLTRADNSALLGFMGTQNNQNIGFYGGPVGFGFTYDAINSRVGIGTSTPSSSLNVNGQITVDQKNFGGYGGLLLKGNVPGNNYPNIAFSIKNNAGTPADVVAAMIQGDLINNVAGSETIDLTFLTSFTGLGGLTERMRIKGNGNVGIGTSTPNAPLSFPAVLGKKITLFPGGTGDVGFAVAGNRLQIYSDNPNADVAIGYDAAGTFNERFAFKPNGALAIYGNAGNAGQVLQSNGSGAAPTWITSVTVHFIGESYGGGIVFYVYDNGQHGLIAATADYSPDIQWNNGNYNITNATRDGIGAGKFNTERITNNYGAGTYAAQISANYQAGNYGDWYLPSKYELNLLYLQRTVVGGFSNVNYWSSSEVSGVFAWIQTFATGVQSSFGDKANFRYMREIRAF